ncbi:hypothetical protein SNOG_09514 [Parastagonospora nodorum SN15]|uniref:Uncharacterized protein n=1 Tax=Phaeosphaeria nodorum (strain SN15 / ATCC MYA-4574 / FGSC 10173) TaxID=321614 RepID=Q0UFF0_PHANO|nr:hypothetical protein SNOG_09514 [Parastagonospora nodorum SN15]EAT82779.1 hypothetical protein SNOG_09514 [Parastagonospora nodorum SN15]
MSPKPACNHRLRRAADEQGPRMTKDFPSVRNELEALHSVHANVMNPKSRSLFIKNL